MFTYFLAILIIILTFVIDVCFSCFYFTSNFTQFSLRWRPPWWLPNLNYQSPLSKSNDIPIETQIKGQGFCINLFRSHVQASVCSCPIGYGGLGCVRLPTINDSFGIKPTFYDLGPSKDAFILALSNLAFLPGLILALIRRLWIPALVYAYTLLFSMVRCLFIIL